MNLLFDDWLKMVHLHSINRNRRDCNDCFSALTSRSFTWHLSSTIYSAFKHVAEALFRRTHCFLSGDENRKFGRATGQREIPYLRASYRRQTDRVSGPLYSCVLSLSPYIQGTHVYTIVTGIITYTRLTFRAMWLRQSDCGLQRDRGTVSIVWSATGGRIRYGELHPKTFQKTVCFGHTYHFISFFSNLLFNYF